MISSGHRDYLPEQISEIYFIVQMSYIPLGS